MAQVIQLPKDHMGIPSQDDKTNTLIFRLINKLKQKSHQNIKNFSKHVRKNPRLTYFTELAGQATNTIQKVPKNLKKRIDSVLNHIGNIMASADPISQPTFYQSLVIAFIKKYPYQLCDKQSEDAEMPSFEEFYEHFQTIYSKAKDASQEEYALALFFYEEVSKEIEDVEYNLVNDVILSAISMTIDSAVLGSHTRNQLYLTYKSFVKIASAQNSPVKNKKQRRDDDDDDDDDELEKDVHQSGKDAWDDDQEQARQSQLDAEDESDKDLSKNNVDLPEIPDIDNIQFESGENKDSVTDVKFVPFSVSLQEFTQRFEGEVIWDQLEEKIAPQTIAKASYEFYQITKINFSEIRNDKPRQPSMLSLRSQQKFIKSTFQQIGQQVSKIVQSTQNKSFEFSEKMMKWIEIQVIGSQQENEQAFESLTQDGRIQRISKVSRKRRLQNLYQRLANLLFFSLGTLYQTVDQKVNFEKWNSYLTPYFDGVKPYYQRVKSFSLTTYQRVNQQVILPINEKVVVVIRKGSVIFTVFVKQKIVGARITQIALEKLNSSQVVVNQYWMQLDFDNDGVVSIEDCKNTARQAYKYLKQKKLVQVKQIASSMYERSVQIFKNTKAKILPIKQKSE